MTVVAGLVAALAVVAAASAVGGGGVVVAEGRVRRRVVHLGGARRGDRSPLGGAAISGVPRRLAPMALGAARRRRRADRALPLLLDQVTRHLRAGSSLPAAVQVAASGADDAGTAQLADELGAGATLSVAVEAWRDRCPTPARELASAALVLAAEAGGSVAAVLDGVNETLRDRVALEREVAALSSQARASAAVLVVAPIGFSVLAAAADPRVAHVLVASPLGWACLAGGALLDAGGAMWMARLVGRSR